ncbi:MAG TPA: hypothetical protein VGX23_22570 [Actinocrinis sp.]|nr:hypothetical protein [Actinocrinis sp.]
MAGAQDGGVGGAVHWTDDHRFEVVVAVPVVQQAVNACAAQARLPMSAQQFLAVAAAQVPIPAVRLALHVGAAERGHAMGLKLGFRTGKSRGDLVPAPIGLVTAVALCSLAYHGQVVRSVEQSENGCTLIGEIPSDAKTFGGVLRVQVARSDARQTFVHAAAEIPGQLYDWGKSKKSVADLFAAVLALPGAASAGSGNPAILGAIHLLTRTG